METIDCQKHGFSLGARVSTGVRALLLGETVANRRTRSRSLYFQNEGKVETDEIYALDSEILEAGIPLKYYTPYSPIPLSPNAKKWLKTGHYVCFECLESLRAQFHQFYWLHLHLSIDPTRIFRLTVNELPEFEVFAEDGDKALILAAEELKKLEASGADIPMPVYGYWLEYAMNALGSMGKVRFEDLPCGMRFMRKGFPTMWDKLSAEHALPHAEWYEPVPIPAEEIVWHYKDDTDFSPADRQARIEWTGNQSLHF